MGDSYALYGPLADWRGNTIERARCKLCQTLLATCRGLEDLSKLMREHRATCQLPSGCDFKGCMRCE